MHGDRPETAQRSQGHAASRTTEHQSSQRRQVREVLEEVRAHCERLAGRLTERDLEHLSDMLLRVMGPDEQYPHRAVLEYQTQEIHSLDEPLSPIAREACEQPAPDPGPPLQALIARLLVAARLISRKQREVARLHLWGHTLAEVAGILGIPVSTARSRWRSARRHLQRAVEELGEGSAETALQPRADCGRAGSPTYAGKPDLRDRSHPPQESAPGGVIASEQAREAFHEDQQRCRYYPPRHCPRGRERCRKTGICPFARTRVVG